MVAWQASWLKRSTTAKGNSIYGFRVDTVKHVDDTMATFQNELVDRDPDFPLDWRILGANYKDTKGDLRNQYYGQLVGLWLQGYRQVFGQWSTA